MIFSSLLGTAPPEADVVSALLVDPNLPEHLTELAKASAAINEAYGKRFAERHGQRLADYKQAVQVIRAQVEYSALQTQDAEPALAALSRRAVETFDLPEYAVADRSTGATLASIEEDLELLPSLQAGAAGRLRQILDAQRTKEDTVEVIRLGDFLPKTQPLSDFTDAEIEEAVDKLRQKLYALRELKRTALWD